jgi:hypothetical protein
MAPIINPSPKPQYNPNKKIICLLLGFDTTSTERKIPKINKMAPKIIASPPN